MGVTGSIAAYKAALLVRLLVKAGAEVQVMMTPMSKEFITPLTMATLSKHPILVDFYNPENGDWNSHVSLGIWADAFLIAPASANTIAKMAGGMADNLLLTTYLSARCPVIVAPAMDVDMYMHQTTQQNIAALLKAGVHMVNPSTGELASGLDGKGRMEEPEQIVASLVAILSKKKTLSHKHFLLTAGPTYESIDPVRFIGNHSTGKMGFAIAEALAERGAKVSLVTGPTALQTHHPSITLIPVTAAAEMHEAAMRIFPQADGAVLCAAVADFTPAHPSDKKIKRGNGDLHLALKPTVDIAAALGKVKNERQILVGFALETNDEVDNAKKKLITKNLDMIVLNSLKDEGAGFSVDTNKITLIDRQGEARSFALKPKKQVAEDIVDAIENLKGSL